MYSNPGIILCLFMVKFNELKKSSIQWNGKQECSRECHEAIWLLTSFFSITQFTVMLGYSNGHCNTDNFGTKLHVFKPSDYLVPLYGKVHWGYKVCDTMATKTFLFFYTICCYVGILKWTLKRNYIYANPTITLYLFMVKFTEVKKSSIQWNGKKEYSREWSNMATRTFLFLHNLLLFWGTQMNRIWKFRGI